MQEVKEKDNERINSFFDEMNTVFKKHKIYPYEREKHVFLIKLEDGQVAMITVDKEKGKDERIHTS